MTTGRPRATSRDVIAEAACELFLEQGFAATTVAQITARAGVSRSSFFNYFGSKADVLWGGFDERADAAVTALGGGGDPVAVLRELVADFEPDSLALAITNADAMGLAADLSAERWLRCGRLARAITERVSRGGEERLAADVRAASAAGAVLAAIWAWAGAGPAHSELGALFERALAETSLPLA